MPRHHYYPQFRYRDNPEPEDNLRTEPVDPKTAGKLLIVVGDILILYRYKRYFTVSICIDIEILKPFVVILGPCPFVFEVAHDMGGVVPSLA